MDLLDRLLEHDQWATAQVLAWSGGLSDAQLDREFDVGQCTLRATLAHIIFNVGSWTGLMTRQPVTRDAQGEDRSVAALADVHERSYPAFAAFARKVHDEGRLEETFADHYDLPMTFGGAILMVTQHNVEHRTEALHILARLGVPELPDLPHPLEVDHGLWDFKRRGF